MPEVHTLVCDDFLPLIESVEVTGEEYRRCVRSYTDLPVALQLQEVVQRIQKSMIELARFIDPAKLNPSDSVRFFQKASGEIDTISTSDFLPLLSRSEPWLLPSQKTKSIEVDDSILRPWRPLLNQYKALSAFLQSAWNSKAIPQSTFDLYARIKADVLRLEDRLTKEWQRSHLRSFGLVDLYARGIKVPSAGEAEKLQQIKSQAEKVCQHLLWRVMESQRSRLGAKFVLKYNRGTFSYRKKDHRPREQAEYLKLCEAFYASCPKSGRMFIEKLREEIMKKNPNLRSIDREGIRLSIKSLNRWAEGDGLPMLLKLDGKEIVRCI